MLFCICLSLLKSSDLIPMDRSLSISLFLSCRLSLIEELTALRRKYNSP